MRAGGNGAMGARGGREAAWVDAGCGLCRGSVIRFAGCRTDGEGFVIRDEDGLEERAQCASAIISRRSLMRSAALLALTPALQTGAASSSETAGETERKAAGAQVVRAGGDAFEALGARLSAASLVEPRETPYPALICFPPAFAGVWSVGARRTREARPLENESLADAERFENIETPAEFAFKLKFVTRSESGRADAVVADRAFNENSLANGYAGGRKIVARVDARNTEATRVRVEYVPSVSRETVIASTSGGARIRGSPYSELFLVNAASGARGTEPQGDLVFRWSELVKQLYFNAQNDEPLPLTSEFEVITELALRDNQTMVGRRRVAVYLRPGDDDFERAKRRAVLLTDFELAASRLSA